MKVLQTNGLKAFMASIRDKFISKSDTVEVETLGIDNIPTQNSDNLVKSSGVYTELATKLTEPSSNLAVGKYFRIASLDESGHAVLECVDPPTAPVQSVSAAGTALTPDENGNVDIPIGEHQKFGVVKVASSDWGVTQQLGILYLPHPQNKYIALRSPASGRAITVTTYDYAVKCAMTDGKGAAWTDTERLAALLRMGCTVDENGFVKWTATPSE